MMTEKEGQADWEQIAEITVTYHPQHDQKHRCSDNVSNMNITKNCLKFTVEYPNDYPCPIFSVYHDKKGVDTLWWSDLYDNKTVPYDTQQGEGGMHHLYICTQDGMYWDVTSTPDTVTLHGYPASCYYLLA